MIPQHGAVQNGAALAIRQAADRAITITRQLLAFSPKQVLQPELLDLNGQRVAGR